MLGSGEVVFFPCFFQSLGKRASQLTHFFGTLKHQLSGMGRMGRDGNLLGCKLGDGPGWLWEETIDDPTS